MSRPLLAAALAVLLLPAAASAESRNGSVGAGIAENRRRLRKRLKRCARKAPAAKRAACRADAHERLGL